MPTSHESLRPATEEELVAFIQEYAAIAGQVARDAQNDLFHWVVTAASPEQRKTFTEDLAVLVLSSIVTSVAWERGLLVPRGDPNESSRPRPPALDM